jgi:hypothetical protein
MPESSCASSCSRSSTLPLRPQSRRLRLEYGGGELLFVSVHFHEAVLGAELDAGRICLLAVLPHDPTVQKLRAYVERPVGIPDQVGSGVGAMVVRDKGGRRGRGKAGIVYCGVRIERAGPQSFLPVVLIGCFDTHPRSCFEGGG